MFGGGPLLVYLLITWFYPRLVDGLLCLELGKSEAASLATMAVRERRRRRPPVSDRGEFAVPAFKDHVVDVGAAGP